jgi:hypothetical protein
VKKGEEKKRMRDGNWGLKLIDAGAWSKLAGTEGGVGGKSA